MNNSIEGKNANIFLDFAVGESVKYRIYDFDCPGKSFNGKVVSVEDDHIIVSVPEISDHLYFDEDNINDIIR